VNKVFLLLKKLFFCTNFTKMCKKSTGNIFSDNFNIEFLFMDFTIKWEVRTDNDVRM
jgi:hypothetical protein